MVSGGGMASARETIDGDGDGVRTTRLGLRRDVDGVLVLAVGVLAGRAMLEAGEPQRRVRTEPPGTEEPAAAAPRPGTPPTSGGAPAAQAASAADPTAALADGSAQPSIALPATRGAQLRALRKLGITPKRGKDGRPELDAAPLIGALNAAGVHEGIAAFPRPGTDPPKRGIIVPDDFELPAGFVRHFQSTDDGIALPPILMFHPDFDFVGPNDEPIELPPDLVVPPELAPPGMPIHMLEIPEPGHAR